MIQITLYNRTRSGTIFMPLSDSGETGDGSGLPSVSLDAAISCRPVFIVKYTKRAFLHLEAT